jgi:intracellular sulfur oxidation DsrE/DsrF family protein
MLSRTIIFLSIYLFFTTSLLSTELDSDVVVKKVVYDLKTGDIEKFETRLLGGIVAHTNHYNDKLEELKTIVIIHGNSYKFFMSDLNGTVYSYDEKLQKKKIALSKRIKSLVKQYDVKFYVCEVGINTKKLNKKSFYPFINMVKNAVVGLIDAQNNGYAYIPLH